MAEAQVPTPAIQYRDTVIRFTHLYLPAAVPPAWVAGQIHQESRWHAGARSRVGAAGLLQIMPATAKDIARTCQLPGFDPLNPRQAVQGGICYDGQLWRLVGRLLPGWTSTVQDRWWLTTRSYNGGAGWLQKEAAMLRSLELTGGPAVWLGSVCREFRPAVSCDENLTYPIRIRDWARLYQGWA
jgi:membrane-bound lytic murein transglycosylase MltF